MKGRPMLQRKDLFVSNNRVRVSVRRLELEG